MNRKPIEIIQAVKFNAGEAWALNRTPSLEYERYGDTIIGMDFPFFYCYCYEDRGNNWKAFGGNKFDLKMTNGEIVHCDGKWWSGATDKAKSLIGDNIADVTANGIDSLKSCYVFCGYVGEMESIKELRNSYTGDVMPYHDYKRIING